MDWLIHFLPLMGWMAAAPYIAAGAGSLLSGMSSGKGERRSPVYEETKRAQRGALGLISGDIPGASSLATAGSKAYLGLLGQGGINLADLGVLGEIASTGSPVDINPLVTATKDVAYRNIDEQAKALQAQFGAQGNRFSSDVYRGAGLVRERGGQDLNETLMRLAYGAAESAQSRRLGAAELLGNVAGAARQSAYSPVMAALGRDIPSPMPSATSQALSAVTPALVYGLAQRNQQNNTGVYGPQQQQFKGTQPGKG